ncbi:MAG TPA: arylesterase [Stellaceae bacterium]|nr:arylesterase [Stellaceae bacterium]
MLVNALGALLALSLLAPDIALAQAPSAPAPAPAPRRLLAFGDSLTAGYGLAPEDAFPVKLQARLQADGFKVTVANGGFSGDTTSGGLARVKWVLADHPQYALIEFGANDALRGLDPQLTRANLIKILDKMKSSGVRVLLIGMRAPANWGPDYEQAFNSIYPDLAKQYGVPLYPFFLEGVAFDRTLNQPDGLHPNADGVDVIVRRIAPAVEKLLRTKPARP